LCSAHISVCPFDKSDLYPDWRALGAMMSELRPKLVSSFLEVNVLK
jgi:hypothetical protein